MEASALELRQGTAQTQGILSGSLLRLRSDEQLVELFRAGSEDAFCAIHDRYRKRLEAYAAQMLNGSGQDAEDALQDVFERAYFGLRAHHRDMALRAWLYRVAHNRCLDQLRRPVPTATIEPDEAESRQLDPVRAAEQRETLSRLIVDIGRLPHQQRSALLLREMSGMSYAELAGALAVSVPAVKSLLVRARLGLAAAGEARDTACAVIRQDLILAHDRGARPGANVRRHLRDCSQCRHFRRSMRSMSRNLAAVSPVLAPIGFLVKLFGGGGGAAGGGLTGSGGGAMVGGGAAAGGGTLAASGAVGTAGAVTGGLAAAGGAGHVAALVAAALVTAGGAVAVQPTSTPAVHLLNRSPEMVAPPASVQSPVSNARPAAATAGTSAVSPSPASEASPAGTGKAGAQTSGTGLEAKRSSGSDAASASPDPGSSATATASTTSGSASAGATDSTASTSSSATSTAGASSSPSTGQAQSTSGGTSGGAGSGTTQVTSSAGTGTPSSPSNS